MKHPAIAAAAVITVLAFVLTLALTGLAHQPPAGCAPEVVNGALQCQPAPVQQGVQQ